VAASTRQLRRRPPGPSRRWRPPLSGRRAALFSRVWAVRDELLKCGEGTTGGEDSVLTASTCGAS